MFNSNQKTETGFNLADSILCSGLENRYFQTSLILSLNAGPIQINDKAISETFWLSGTSTDSITWPHRTGSSEYKTQTLDYLT